MRRAAIGTQGQNSHVVGRHRHSEASVAGDSAQHGALCDLEAYTLVPKKVWYFTPLRSPHHGASCIHAEASMGMARFL